MRAGASGSGFGASRSRKEVPVVPTTMVMAQASAERRFYTGMAIAILVVVFVGFAPTFFLRPFFPDTLADIVSFALFVAIGIAGRRDMESHKRLIMLATITLLAAAIARWPVLSAFGPPAYFGCTDLFIVALGVWDFRSRGKLHPVTLWGGLLVIASQPLRLAIMGTDAWLATAPQPADERVALVEVPPRRVAVVRYSGTWSEKNYAEQLAALRTFMAERKLRPSGEPIFARYDPPFMPWFLRRNEIQVPVQAAPVP